MGWWGKTIGTGLGAVLLGPLGAGIGYAVGNVFDSALESPDSEDDFELYLFVHFFACLAKVAKADGKVSKEEIAIIELIMNERLGLDLEETKLAINVFKEAKDSEVSFEELIDQLAKLNKYDLEVGVDLLAIFHEVAIADGVINTAEMHMLSYAERSLRVTPGTLNGLMGSASVTSLEAAYQLLGCNSGMADSEIKSSYRKKCTQFHPDKLYSANLAPEFIEFANFQLVKINQAYEQICTSRSSVVV